MTRYRLCPDAFLRRHEDGTWIFSNPRTHRHVQVDTALMSALMQAPPAGDENQWAEILSAGTGQDRTSFPHSQGLMVDPTGIGPTTGNALSGEALFQLFRKFWLIQKEDGSDYAEYLGPRTSLLDTQHQGSFHQVIGYHQMVQLRIKDTWRWWHDQKFLPDGTDLKPGLYKSVQGYFFDAYFSKQNLKGKAGLDFACGNGFYSNRFARWGARITGIDTSPELIAIARKNYGDGLNLICPSETEGWKNALKGIPDASQDFIYLSDALLFFFHSLKSSADSPDNDLKDLLSHFQRILKKDGRFYLMEPNGAFWLSSWTGETPRPAAIVTEYRKQIYHVAPTPDRVIHAMSKAGFLIADLIHPDVDPQAELDPLSKSFAENFPLWDFYVCVPDNR